jgi:excisionase family DNA binding protein
MNNEALDPTSLEAEQQFINKRQVALMFGATERTIESYTARGILPFYRLGRTVRFHFDDIRNHLAENFKVVGRPQVRRVFRGREINAGTFRSSH